MKYSSLCSLYFLILTVLTRSAIRWIMAGTQTITRELRGDGWGRTCKWQMHATTIMLVFHWQLFWRFLISNADIHFYPTKYANKFKSETRNTYIVNFSFQLEGRVEGSHSLLCLSWRRGPILERICCGCFVVAVVPPPGWWGWVSEYFWVSVSAACSLTIVTYSIFLSSRANCL